MSPNLIRKSLPYILAVALALCALLGAYHHGVNTTTTEWSAKWNRQAQQLAEVKAAALVLAREEDQRRQSAIDKVRQDAEQQIARAETDATAANVAADSLRRTAQRLAARAGQCPSDTTVAQSGEATAQPGVVLADVLGRADESAGQLAAAYDRARAAGLACEQAYDSLLAGGQKP